MTEADREMEKRVAIWLEKKLEKRLAQQKAAEPEAIKKPTPSHVSRRAYHAAAREASVNSWKKR